ncbi:MAG: endonuclease/exonuclease/phosphatase family protein [Bdellovibrionota bacterium]
MSFFTESRLRLVEFNLENLFVFLDHYKGQDLDRVTEREWQGFSSSTTPNKPLKQVRELARAIADLDPDILMLCEVGGLESLANFSKYFLSDRYAPHLLEGNSDRGIDIGYLVRRALPFTYDLISHKHRPLDFLYPHERQTILNGFDHLRSAKVDSHKFSRDVLELRVFDVDPTEPALIILLVHLKSQLDRSRIDPGGRDRRKAELDKLVKIQKEIEDEFEGRVPVVLTGDFNGSASRPEPEVEFETIYRDSKLEDALEWAKQPADERFTYMQLSNSRTRPGRNKQLDYVFLPPALGARVNEKETWVYRFKDDFGMTMIVPRNFNEKKLLPSDHYPVVVTLDPAKR